MEPWHRDLELLLIFLMNRSVGTRADACTNQLLPDEFYPGVASFLFWLFQLLILRRSCRAHTVVRFVGKHRLEVIITNFLLFSFQFNRHILLAPLLVTIVVIVVDRDIEVVHYLWLLCMEEKILRLKAKLII